MQADGCRLAACCQCGATAVLTSEQMHQDGAKSHSCVQCPFRDAQHFTDMICSYLMHGHHAGICL